MTNLTRLYSAQLSVSERTRIEGGEAICLTSRLPFKPYVYGASRPNLRPQTIDTVGDDDA